MAKVQALHSFTHNGESHSRNSTWPASAKDAEALSRAGLVRIIDDGEAKSPPAAPKKTTTTAKKPATKKRPATKPAEPKPGGLIA